MSPRRILTDRLAQLLIEYARIKPRVDELTEELRALVDAIKLEATLQHPDETSIPIDHPALPKRLRLTWVKKPRIDAKRMRTEVPELYARYTVSSGRWELRSE